MPCVLMVPSASSAAMMPMGMIQKMRKKLESRLRGLSGYSTVYVSGNAGVIGAGRRGLLHDPPPGS